jgi:hypothetical protein
LTGPNHADNADHNPEHVQQDIGVILFEYGASGKNHRIGGIKSPDEQKRTFGTQPTDQRKAENAHQHAKHFYKFDVLEYE